MSLVHIQAHLLDLSAEGFSVLPRLKNGHMDVMDILLLPRIVVTQFLLDGISSQTMNSRPITKENLKYQKEIGIMYQVPQQVLEWTENIRKKSVKICLHFHYAVRSLFNLTNYNYNFQIFAKLVWTPCITVFDNRA